MEKIPQLVKIFDLDKNFLGKGTLLSLNDDIIIVKGNNLPEINSGTKVYINIYNDFKGIYPYLCEISVASVNQITSRIKSKEPIIERRESLKVRTNLSFYINKIYRNDEDITDEFPPIKFNMLNLSVGGMRISANFYFKLNDQISFYFEHSSNEILLEAKIIRIDTIIDEDNKNIIHYYYGCRFINVNRNAEAFIFKYLFERQLNLYKGKWIT